jgi:hypothetical protein
MTPQLEEVLKEGNNVVLMEIMTPFAVSVGREMSKLALLGKYNGYKGNVFISAFGDIRYIFEYDKLTSGEETINDRWDFIESRTFGGFTEELLHKNDGKKHLMNGMQSIIDNSAKTFTHTYGNCHMDWLPDSMAQWDVSANKIDMFNRRKNKMTMFADIEKTNKCILFGLYPPVMKKQIKKFKDIDLKVYGMSKETLVTEHELYKELLASQVQLHFNHDDKFDKRWYRPRIVMGLTAEAALIGETESLEIAGIKTFGEMDDVFNKDAKYFLDLSHQQFDEYKDFMWNQEKLDEEILNFVKS